MDADSRSTYVNSNNLIFGCGAIGGNIAVQLAMAGVEHFILYDYDKVCFSDASRHLFYTEHSVGEIKISALSTRLKEINKKIIEQNYEIMSLFNDLIKKELNISLSEFGFNID
jgi:molybdopterin/thiamine biosynthesis adenylyltransferase